MRTLTEGQLLAGLLAVGIILLIGRGTAEVARRARQPEVLGELVGGFLLGPSVLGALLPSVYHGLFLTGPVSLGLSLFSWVGAILLLFIAGLEVDMAVLRQEARAGGLAAALAIASSLVAGTLFAWRVLGKVPPDGFFLGIVLSVTAVSVAAKLLMERGVLRRSYAQVILAAGVASEVLVWLLIAVVSSARGGSPLLAGARSAVFAIVFFLIMMTAGRRFTFWAMRRTADLTSIVNGQLSLVLILTFAAAAFTQWLGLHALLGAFVFGVVLGQAPRADLDLRAHLQTLTVGLFAPIFFVLAGMRVDIFKVGGVSAIGTVLLLFAVASGVKVSLGALGARLGGLRGWQPLLVGVGLNLKGGTDVIVAILGAELGLLASRTYTLYAVVAILTVLISPTLIAALEKRVPPSEGEQRRLDREEAARRSYLPRIERVLVPVMPELLPAPAADLVQALASVKGETGELFDITEMVLGRDGAPEQGAPVEVDRARDSLKQAGELREVELTKRSVDADPDGVVQTILEASRDYGLIVLGAGRPEHQATLTLGTLQDRIIDQASADVLVVVADQQRISPKIERILVPVNGLEYSMAAGDVAAHVARATGAEVVLFNVMHPELDAIFWHEQDRQTLLESGYRILRELAFRIARLEVVADERVELAEDPGQAIVQELGRQPYQLVVLGAVDRSGDNQLYLGSPVQKVLAQSEVPTLILVSHEAAGQVAA